MINPTPYELLRAVRDNQAATEKESAQLMIQVLREHNIQLETLLEETHRRLDDVLAMDNFQPVLGLAADDNVVNHTAAVLRVALSRCPKSATVAFNRLQVVIATWGSVLRLREASRSAAKTALQDIRGALFKGFH